MKRKSLIILLVIMCFIAVGCGSKSNKTTNEEKKEEDVKKVTYFSDSKTTDKLGFTMSYYDDVNVLFGINEENISADFDESESYLKNDKIEIKSFDDDDISFEYSGEDFYIDFETGYIYYNDEETIVENNNDDEQTTDETTIDSEKDEENDEENDEDADEEPDEKSENTPKIAKFDSEDVVYQDGNYIITSYYSRYYIYYIIKVEERYSDNYGYAIDFDYYYDLDKAKEKVKLFKSKFTICSYEDDISVCKDADGNKVDYKKYRFAKDMIIDYLAANNMYIDSYEKVSYFSYGTVKIVDETSLAEGEEITFGIYVHDYSYDSYSDPIGKLNGSEIYYSDSAWYVYMKNKEKYNSIEIDLPYGVEDNAENVMKVLKETFKK